MEMVESLQSQLYPFDQRWGLDWISEPVVASVLKRIKRFKMT